MNTAPLGAEEIAAMRRHTVEHGCMAEGGFCEDWGCEDIARLLGTLARREVELAEARRLVDDGEGGPTDRLITVQASQVVRLRDALVQAEVENERIEADKERHWRTLNEELTRRCEAEADLAAERARRERYLNILRNVEWRFAPGYEQVLYCPECENDQTDGHRTDCALRAALAEPAGGEAAGREGGG